jgi:hypothetical protein
MPVGRSPRINHLEWGAIEVEGLPRARDVMLYPCGGREWDWRETGTRHHPGIQPVDVKELIDAGCEVVILSKGMHLRLETMPETLSLLAEASVTVHVFETRAAADLYNILALDSAVGALMHSTC